MTFQQLLILADQDGNVDMTLDAVSRRTTIPLNILQVGITPLLEPDQQSRTPDAEGRRIVPLMEGRDWGWHIVNYEHYRQMKREDDRRDYHRAYWHKRKDKVSTQLNTTQPTQRNQPIAYAEAKEVKTLALKRAFERFWDSYPKKRSKDAAFKAFSKVHPDEQLLAEILAAIERAKTQDAWLKDEGQFIPYPASWLNAGAWKDEDTPLASVERKVAL